MKNIAHSLIYLFFLFPILDTCTQQDHFPVLKGPYLGQEPPGMKAEIFAGGIISTANYEGCCTFLNNGNSFICASQSRDMTIYFFRHPIDQWNKGDISFQHITIQDMSNHND